MIRVSLVPADIGSTTFAYSPLAEVTSSLRMLASGSVSAVHRPWYDEVRPALRRLDLSLLYAVAPYRHELPTFMFGTANGVATTIDQQLRDVASVPAEHVHSELATTWAGAPMPPAARSVIADRPAAASRIAEALWDYWSVALEPYWTGIQSVLEDDLGHRRRTMAAAGLTDVIAGLHPSLRIVADSILIDKPDSDIVRPEGNGLRFVPSVFVWPHLAFGRDTPGAPTVAYGTRRQERLWNVDTNEDAELAALLGPTRAKILLELELPYSTTTIANKLGYSPAVVSQHLAVLRRSGLVRSWRSGRVVYSQRTALAERVITAESPGSPRCDARRFR